MQANCHQLHSSSGTASVEDVSASQCVHATRLAGERSYLHSGDVHIQINSIPREYVENPSSRNTRSGVHSCTHECVHGRFRSHAHSEARQPDDTATESGEHGSSSFSEFRHLFKWLQKCLPYILILGVKLVMQHITGISLGIGLLTTFMYANKSIVNQVFLRGYWYMLLEELCQYYRTFVPIPVWFRYLISYGELGNVTRWSLGILLALLYLILKSYGVAASKRQCSDVDDICSICQAEFQKPVLLICQHIFCEECITLWFNREKTCPLCRTVISDHINKWKDGATSLHLQIY
ncbi:RING finger and transmembrane domain-containing protein 1 [Heterocephalus glaber]|uniref:E3 ubiquitin-protein ligase RNFT1 n=1 Tax=Heterocephalus glaber TaxID=10181 RepID=G5C899_HETGA|nr:RING finger and transmembrane domain-containing protein 1 [Heterocephalus glaber]